LFIYCRDSFEEYYKYTIEWLIKTDPNCISEEKYEEFLVSKSGIDLREPKINIFEFFKDYNGKT